MNEHLQRHFLSLCRDPIAARALVRRILRSSFKDQLSWDGLELVPDPDADQRVGQTHLAAAFHIPGPGGCALVKLVHVTEDRGIDALFAEYMRLLPHWFAFLRARGLRGHVCTVHALLETSPDELDGDENSVAPRETTVAQALRK